MNEYRYLLIGEIDDLIEVINPCFDKFKVEGIENCGLALGLYEIDPSVVNDFLKDVRATAEDYMEKWITEQAAEEYEECVYQEDCNYWTITNESWARDNAESDFENLYGKMDKFFTFEDDVITVGSIRMKLCATDAEYRERERTHNYSL